MPLSPPPSAVQSPFDRLRTELADLAFELERQGRRDAADVVMQLDARVRELAGEADRGPVGDEGGLIAAGLGEAGSGPASPVTAD